MDDNNRNNMEDGSEDGMEKSLTDIDTTLDIKNENRKKITGLLTSYHGVVYQVQWLMTVALEAYHRLHRITPLQGTEFKFRTADFMTEDPEAGKMDDVTWRYETDEIGKYDYYFLQAKHKLNESGKDKITLKELLKPKQKESNSKPPKIDKRPFALEKYFISYKEDIKRNEKYSNCREVNLIIATNIDFDEKLKDSLQLHSIPILEYTEQQVGRSPKCYQFKKPDDDNPNINQIIEYLGKTHELKLVISELMEYVTEDKVITKDTLIGKYFSDLLANNIIHISGKFNENFIRGHQHLSDKAKKFRNAVLQVGYHDERNSVSEHFLEQPEKMAKSIALKINQHNENVTIKIYKGTVMTMAEINKLAYFVFVQDLEHKDKVKFSSLFLSRPESSFPEGNLIEFRNILLGNLKGEKRKSLEKYRFGIKDFVTCKEFTISEETFWNFMGRFSKFCIDETAEKMRGNYLDILKECTIKETDERLSFTEEFKSNQTELDKEVKEFRDFLLKDEFDEFEEIRKCMKFEDWTGADQEAFGKKIAELIIKSCDSDPAGNTCFKEKCIPIIRYPLWKRHIAKLANYILVEDDTNQEWVKFSSSFSEGIESEEVAEFRDTLIAKLEQQGLDKHLTEYRFKIVDFKTCTEMFASEKAFWKGIEDYGIDKYMVELFPNNIIPDVNLDDAKEEVKNFLSHLVFIVGCSQEMLKNFIKKECISFAGINTDYVAYEFQVRMSDCLNLQDKDYISTPEEVEQFFDKAKSKIKYLTLIGSTLEYQKELENYGIKFENEFIQDYHSNEGNGKCLSFFNSNSEVINVRSDNVTLTALKVFQAMKEKDLIEGSYIFIRLSTFLLLRDRIIQAFAEINLLIIVCDRESEEFSANFYEQIEDILKKNLNKEIILISGKNHTRVDSLGEKEIVEIVDQFNGFSDFTQETQAKLLEKRGITFQGRNAKLSILNQDLLDSLDANVLCKIIKNERIVIGELGSNSEYVNNDVKSSYIERNFCQRVTKIMLRETDLRNKPPQVVIVAAKPGMGKSSFLDNLAQQMKIEDKTLWVVKVNLTDYENDFEKFQEYQIQYPVTPEWLEKMRIILLYKMVNFKIFETRKDKDTFLPRLFNSLRIENSEIYLDETNKVISDGRLIEVKLFNSFFNDGKVIFLFDNFDQINSSYRDAVIELFEFLKSRMIEMWITILPLNGLIEHLEMKLNTSSFSLLPLSESKRQKDFLREYWYNHLSRLEIYKERLEIFIEYIFKEFSISGHFPPDFLEVPMHLGKIVKILKDEMEDFVKSKSKRISNHFGRKIGEKLNFSKVYETCYAIEFKEFSEEDYGRLALFQIFDGRILETLLTEEEIERTRDLIEDVKENKWKTCNIREIFFYKTLAEYFTALFIWNKFKFIPFRDFDEFVEKVIIKKLIKCNRVQICNYILSIAIRDQMKSRNLKRIEKKIPKLFEKLITQIQQPDHHYVPKCIRSTITVLLKIIEHFLSREFNSEGGICKPKTAAGRWKVICISGQMGYPELMKTCSNVPQKDWKIFSTFSKKIPLSLSIRENKRIENFKKLYCRKK